MTASAVLLFFPFFALDIDIVNKETEGIAYGTSGDPPTMDGMQLHNALIVMEDCKVMCVCKPGQELIEKDSPCYCKVVVSKALLL